MPIYEYECGKCGNVFEVMHSVNGDGPDACEMANCKGKPHRKISASGFILKGSGWYATDYPSEARKKGWEQESKAANSSAAPSGDASAPASAPAPAAAESKPAAPKESALSKAQNKNPYSGGKKKAASSTGKKAK